MKKPVNPHLFFYSTIVLALFTQPVTADNLTLGSISDDPTRELKYYLPVAKYLATELKSAGVEEVNVLVAQSIKQMSQLLKEGSVDIYFDSPFPTIEVHRLSGSLPILRRWKKGVSSYHSVVFVRQDSGITSPNELPGKVIAFEEPYSTGSYFLPKASLSNLGLKFVEKTDIPLALDKEKFNNHAQRTWNCNNPLKGGQVVLQRRQTYEMSH